MEKIQKGLFSIVLEKIWIPNIPQATGVITKKTITIGTTKLLSSQVLLNDNYIKFWPQLLEAVIKLLENTNEPPETKGSVPTSTSTPSGKEDKYDSFSGVSPTTSTDDDDLLDSNKTLSSAYVKLHFASPAEHDPHPDIQNSQQYLVKSLEALSSRSPKQILVHINNFASRVRQLK